MRGRAAGEGRMRMGVTGRAGEAVQMAACWFAMAVVVATPLCGRAGDAATNDAAAAQAYAPSSAYREENLEGWRVLVHEGLLAEPELYERTRKVLGAQLLQITRVVPGKALARLREIPIWVERSSTQFACMCYHESPEWLRTHGVNPDKARAVELANPETFLRWTGEQPWMVLHELAHGYHQRVVGHDHQELLACFRKARAARTYESVLRYDGSRARHYALNNVKEYFAEGTEAFFGTNDFYPFVRAELREHDPALFEVLRQLWGEKDAAAE